MKIFKKIVTILIVLLLCTTIRVYAGTTEAKLTAPSKDVKVGETVTVTLSGYRGNGIEGFDAVLKYDKTKLKLTNESSLAAEGYTSVSGTDDLTGEFRLSLMYVGAGKGPTEANIAELKFEVLKEAKVDETLNIKLTDVKLVDSDEQGTALEDVEINLKVVEDAKDPGGNNNTNTGGNNTNTGGNNNTSGGNNNNPGDYPYAGVENYIFIMIFAVAIVAVAVYIKINKYRDIK